MVPQDHGFLRRSPRKFGCPRTAGRKRPMQRNRIGRSEGLMIRFLVDPATFGRLDGEPGVSELEIYTTRPDTRREIHGDRADQRLAAAAARHDPELKAFIECRGWGRRLRRSKRPRKGLRRPRPAHPSDPAVGGLPVYVANFILMDYGTGAIFGCPAHDQRDLDFVNVYGSDAIWAACPPGVAPGDLQGGHGRLRWRGRDDQFALPRRHDHRSGRRGGRPPPGGGDDRRTAEAKRRSSAARAFRGSATGVARSRVIDCRQAASCRSRPRTCR